ncbi:MAG: hypothetical protein WA581_15565 [Candidatus Acidiferrales bacterium]
MDEAERELAIAFAEQAMSAVQNVAKRTDSIGEVLASFSIVMQMDFNVGDSGVSHFRQGLDQIWTIFLFRKKESVTGAIARAIEIAAAGDFGPGRAP